MDTRSKEKKTVWTEKTIWVAKQVAPNVVKATKKVYKKSLFDVAIGSFCLGVTATVCWVTYCEYSKAKQKKEQA